MDFRKAVRAIGVRQMAVHWIHPMGRSIASLGDPEHVVRGKSRFLDPNQTANTAQGEQRFQPIPFPIGEGSPSQVA